jgi:hypothetical protein
MIQKLPWPSLAILLIAYTSFAAALPPLNWLDEPPSFSAEVRLWILATLLALSFTALLTAPLRQLKQGVVKGFQSDLGLLLGVVTLGFFSVLILSRIHVFYRGFVLLCAGALARLDLQTLGFNEWHAFFILAITSAFGLIVGGVMAYLS